MPELPEIETACRGITPHILKHSVLKVIVRDGRLRWPVPARINSILRGHSIRSVTRRGKYILVGFQHGSLILHLGMSGSLRIVQKGTPYRKHDHVELGLIQTSACDYMIHAGLDVYSGQRKIRISTN